MTKENFRKLFDEWFDPVRSYIYYRSGDPELSTDIAQETFLKIWEKQLMPERGKEKGLLFKIAGDLFVSTYRKMKVAEKYERTVKFSFNGTTQDHSLEYKELKKNYEKALAQMPEKQRVVFLMSMMEELKYYEIADRLGLSVKAVEKRMTLALTFLKNRLIE